MKYYRRKPLETANGLITAVAKPAAAAQAKVGSPLAVADPGDPPASPEDPVQEASALIQQAADILDEEMAAGVLAARAAGPGWGAPARTQVADAGNQMLLRQVHDFIDALADNIAQIQAPVSQWIADTVQVASPAGGLVLTDDQAVPLLSPKAGVPADSQAEVSFTLHNDSDQPTQISLVCTDLYSPQGHQIAASQVRLPWREVSLGPDAQAVVKVQIGVPFGTPAGSYSGVLMAADLAYLRAVLAVEVL